MCKFWGEYLFHLYIISLMSVFVVIVGVLNGDRDFSNHPFFSKGGLARTSIGGQACTYLVGQIEVGSLWQPAKTPVHPTILRFRLLSLLCAVLSSRARFCCLCVSRSLITFRYIDCAIIFVSEQIYWCPKISRRYIQFSYSVSKMM